MKKKNTIRDRRWRVIMDTWRNVLVTYSDAFSDYYKSLRHILYCGTFVRGTLAKAHHNNLRRIYLFASIL